MLEVRDLRLERQSRYIAFSTELRAGESLALFGPSGCGKTTLLRELAGLPHSYRRTRGSVRLAGQDITEAPPEARSVGFVFQELHLFAGLNVVQNASFGLKVRGVRARERERLAIEWLQQFGLQDKADRSVDQLSGGERQRLALVRALIWRPKLVLLDEPFSALDERTREQTTRALQSFLHMHPTPLVIVTHDAAHVRGWITREMTLDAS